MTGFIALLVSADGLRRCIRYPGQPPYLIHTLLSPRFKLMNLKEVPEPEFAVTELRKRCYELWTRRSQLVYEYRECV